MHEYQPMIMNHAIVNNYIVLMHCSSLNHYYNYQSTYYIIVHRVVTCDTASQRWWLTKSSQCMHAWHCVSFGETCTYIYSMQRITWQCQWILRKSGNSAKHVAAGFELSEWSKDHHKTHYHHHWPVCGKKDQLVDICNEIHLPAAEWGMYYC